MFLGFLASAVAVCVLVAVSLGHRRWWFVAGFVDLVERTGCALALVSGCFALKSAGVMLCLWWVVESYISGLLL